ncbi:MAG: methyltransferase protein [Candidatus Moranbacteria bacterium GW2011_GWA2_39_41]|nr:MAG: methyltransferase protein [Candidatus Moranbacteria bacterium GW2011_GWA2_39_41]
MPISWNEIKTRAIEFSKEWENESSEDAEAKSFWDGFFNVFGITRKRVASFEFQVKKHGGNQGFIDLFWPGVLLVEHKSRGRDLEKAHTQAMDYFPGISEKDLPKYILVSDFEHFKLYDLEERTEQEFSLKDLHKKANLFGFIAGYKKQEYKEEDEVNIKAAELMGKLYDSMAEAGYSGHDLNVLLVRILFCLFADDAGIFNQGQFKRYIENRTSEDGSDLGMHLGMIFQVFNQSPENRPSTLDEELAQFEYVNGGLFADPISIPSFTSQMRQRLIEACAFDWSKISPAIFGSLFQSVMDKDARRHLGAHYTSEKNILKLIKPLFLDELGAELESCGSNIKKLNEFHDKLSRLKFFDPACGCGNFLIISFREIRNLEMKLLDKRYGKGVLGTGVEYFVRVKPEQFFGIEIEEFPARIAQTAMWLMDHQMNEAASQMFGQNIKDLPLTKGATIFIGNALQKDWEEVVSKNELSYIFGNPPFIGSNIMKKNQRDQIVREFDNSAGGGTLDYVTGWYIKAAKYIQNTKIKVAFVSTNSIVQGEQTNLLWGLLQNKYNIKIHFAHRTFKWSNEARGKAAVFCVIVGFANFDTDKKYLYEYEDIKGEAHEIKVKNINAYLIDARDVLIEKKKKPICNVPDIIKGNYYAKSEGLIIEKEDLDFLITNEPNAKKWIKLLIGADEFINNRKRYCLWLVDCSPDELRKMPLVMERVNRVREDRLKSTDKGMQNLAPTRFRETNNPEKCLVIPVVSSERRNYIPMGFIDKNTISTNGNLIMPNAELFHFGILMSTMHMTWVRHVCGRLKSDFRYSKDIVYNNFPWPENPSTEKVKAIEKCAQEVLDVRLKYPTSSLADLYDPLTMPADLVKAHQNLDRAVDSAYGKKSFNSSAERMEFLFGLYEKYVNVLNLK